MNKYQEALDKIKEDYEETHCQGMGTCYDFEDIKLLQKLVDKATPKKPEWGRTELGCGNCESTRIKDRYNGEKNKFCPVCGQAIDWSNDD